MAAAHTEIQLPATDKRAVGTVDDSETEDDHRENSRVRTMVGIEVSALDDSYVE